MANAGQKLAEVGEKTIKICQEAANDEKNILILKEKDDILDELDIISHEVYHRSTKLSAAGFFSIDYSMILFILTNVCNYVIVVYQFAYQSNTLVTKPSS